MLPKDFDVSYTLPIRSKTLFVFDNYVVCSCIQMKVSTNYTLFYISPAALYMNFTTLVSSHRPVATRKQMDEGHDYIICIRHVLLEIVR